MKKVIFVLAVVAVCLVSGNAGAAKMYWTEYYGDICRANLDGSEKEVLLTTDFPEGIALDISGGKMYWNTAYSNQRVMRADLDGSDVETLISTGLDGANEGMALDVPGGKMWWAGCYGMRIHKANLDGSSHTTPISTSNRPGDVALDLSAGKVYYTVIITGAPEICRANFDGSDHEVLINSGIVNPWGIDLDVAGGKMYWVNYGIDKIMRANLDGSDIEELITSGLNGPMGIALDVAGGKMYITNTGKSMDPVGFIQRANLDGTNLETLLTGLGYPHFIALDVEPVSIESGVWVLYNQDLDYTNPPFDDTLTSLDSSGQVLIQKTDFNISQTVGGHRAVAVSDVDQTVLVCENVGAKYASGVPARISKWDYQGNEIFSVTAADEDEGYAAVDVRNDGTIYALTTTGYIWGESILKISSDGNILADASFESTSGFDLAVDEVLGGIYLVGGDIKYCNFDLDLQWTIDPIGWCAVSVDTCNDGTAWVAERTPNRLLRIASDGTILHTVNLDYSPHCVRVDRQDNSVYVGSKEFHKYDENGSLVWTVPLPVPSGYSWSGWSLAIDADRQGVWVGTAYDVRLISFNGDTLLIVDEFPGIDQKYVACYHAPISNTPPVANAGPDQTVYAWIDDIAEVKLDGSGSYDVDDDELEYFWFIGDDQIATGVDPNVELAVGEHTIELIVNDGTEDSEPNAVVITVIEPIDVINALDPDVLKNANLAGALTNKINAVLAMIDDGEYFEAQKKLQNDILKKTNGCADTGQPDKNDWLTTCDAQDLVYPLIKDAIDLLSELI